MNKKIKCIVSALLTSALLFGATACAQVSTSSSATTTTAATVATVAGETTKATTATSESPSLSGFLTLTGSTSMSDVGSALAEAFMTEHPDVTVSVGGNGSGEGPTAVTDGTAQIGMLSRDLKDSESPDSFDKYIIGFDGIAVIVNTDNSVKALTAEQITKIFTGEITNWKDVGGEDAIIQCIGREAASGTRGAFEELMDVEDVCVYAEEQNSTGVVKQSVAGNPNAIGYVSLSSVDNSIIAVEIDGVSATVEKVTSGTYTLQRPFVMIVKKGSTDELANAFMEYVFSEAGQQIIGDDGVVPNPNKS